MGIFDGLIKGLFGGFSGMVKVGRSKPWDDTHNGVFLSSLKPGTVVLQGPTNKNLNFISGGIQGATNSFWTHVLIYAGSEGGKLIRDSWRPKNKLPLYYNEKTKELERKPFPVLTEHEFVEATLPIVRIGDLEKDYCNDTVQQIAFIMELTKTELLIMLDYAYSRVGVDYDVTEIVSDMLPALQIKHHKNLHGCSSLVASAYANAGRCITPIDVAPAAAFPSHIYQTLYPKDGDDKNNFVNHINIPIAKWGYK